MANYVSSSSSSTGGIGFLGVLTVAFIVLKLTDIISWSWWWVLSPLWGPVVLGLTGLFIWFVYMIYKDIKKDRAKKQKK